AGGFGGPRGAKGRRRMVGRPGQGRFLSGPALRARTVPGPTALMRQSAPMPQLIPLHALAQSPARANAQGGYGGRDAHTITPPPRPVPALMSSARPPAGLGFGTPPERLRPRAPGR